jgi:methyl acetate hydrolase
LNYYKAIDKLPTIERSKLPAHAADVRSRRALAIGDNIDWVGRIVQVGERRAGGCTFPEAHLRTAGHAREASGHRRQSDGSLKAEPMGHQPKWPSAPLSFSGGGGIYSSAPDYLTLIRMLMHGGALNVASCAPTRWR